MSRSAEWLVLLALLAPLHAAPAGADEPSAPSLELLEFLGDWETEDGEWVDPGDLLEMPELDPEKSDDEPKSD